MAALLEIVGMSLWFYGYFNCSYLLILCGSILINWIISRAITRLEKNKSRLLMWLGIFGNVLLIFYFKYYDFFISNINVVFKTSFELKHIVLPLGISFFTFQQISYIVDSYKGETKDYKFIEYAAFVSFFPQLVAGPIVLHNELIPQFRNQDKWKFNQLSFANGIYDLAVGLFKKVIIADNFGIAVAWAWNNVVSLSSVEIIIIMLCYTFQIYFDFSGYCDMAIGLGKMFNLDLPVNFNSPYKSKSIIEFWKRWHMTLTRFLRNYIYFPLGGSKKGKARTYINVLIVFVVSGIWHGANWTFIVWGLIHGVANVLNRMFQKWWGKCNVVFQWMVTFLFINVTWLIFRAESMKQAFELIQRAVRMDTYKVRPELFECFKLQEFYILEQFPLWLMLSQNVRGFYFWMFLGLAFLICLTCKNIHEKDFKPSYAKMIITVGMLAWSILSFASVSTFLYFNF